MLAFARYALGLGCNTCTRLRECCSQVETEVIGYSRNQIHQTTYKYYFQGLVVDVILIISLAWRYVFSTLLLWLVRVTTGSVVSWNQPVMIPSSNNLSCFRRDNSRPRLQARRLSLLHLFLHPSSTSEERAVFAGHCEDALEDADPARLAILQVEGGRNIGRWRCWATPGMLIHFHSDWLMCL